jgi:soluble lytic murein transglycosylase-like protein
VFRLCRLSGSLRVLLAAAAGTGLFVSTAHALERVNLRNGFSYDCSRQEPLDAAHVRLILAEPPASAQTAAANFVDLPVSAIASVEMLPDPPPLQPGDKLAVAGGDPPDMHTILSRAGSAHDIDVDLLASVIHAESGGRATAVSRTGAQGLMQLMPGTARDLGVADAFRPDQNVNGGTAYLDALLTRYHDNLALALAAYNAGPAAVDRFHGIPPFRETRAYVTRVMNEFKRRKLALQPLASNAR